MNSACGLPLTEVTPDEITELFFVMTQPTEGFCPVEPIFILACSKASLINCS